MRPGEVARARICKNRHFYIVFWQYAGLLRGTVYDSAYFLKHLRYPRHSFGLGTPRPSLLRRLTFKPSEVILLRNGDDDYGRIWRHLSSELSRAFIHHLPLVDLARGFLGMHGRAHEYHQRNLRRGAGAEKSPHVMFFSIFYSNFWIIFCNLWEARSRLYRSRFLQVNIGWKTLERSTRFTRFCTFAIQ